MDLDELRRQLKTGELYEEGSKLSPKQIWEIVSKNPGLSFDELRERFGIIPSQLANMFAGDVRAKFKPLKDDRLPLPGQDCEHCGRRPAFLWPSLTAYSWDGTGEDPNRDLKLCKECGEEHQQIMEDQWNDYYSDKL